jgi:hypothetical protein
MLAFRAATEGVALDAWFESIVQGVFTLEPERVEHGVLPSKLVRRDAAREVRAASRVVSREVVSAASQRHPGRERVVRRVLRQRSVYDLEDEVAPLEPEVRVGDGVRSDGLGPIDHPLPGEGPNVHWRA